jgi:hypothetical protein
MKTPIDTFLRDEKNKALVNSLKGYFKVKYRGAYYVQMKVEAMRKLRGMGYKTQEIAFIVYGNSKRHDVVCTLMKSHKDIEDADIVRENFHTWIVNKLYPVTHHLNEKRLAYNHEYANRDGHVVYSKISYQLENIC